MAPRIANTPPARPVGRPRAIPRDISSSVREEILSVAAGLFESNGYTATSTRGIAAAAGLRQASLFHYFVRKQDILTELLDRTVRPALELTGRVALEEFDADVGLWLLVHVDVANLCRGPHNLGALQLLPEARHPQFNWFWRRRRQLFKIYADQILRGIDSGLLPYAQRGTSAEVVFGLVESVIIARTSFRQLKTTPVVMADAALRTCGVTSARIKKAAAAQRHLEDW
jgi:AcrR family transcriptional regulator